MKVYKKAKQTFTRAFYKSLYKYVSLQYCKSAELYSFVRVVFILIKPFGSCGVKRMSRVIFNKNFERTQRTQPKYSCRMIG